jgi:hypothetical protein
MNTIINPIEEFLVVRHSYLNGNSYDFRQVIDDALTLGKHTNGRKVVPCLEGDLVQVEETGEIVLTHQNFRNLYLNQYRNLRERKIAASLKEVIDKFLDFKQSNPEQRVVLCFEAKLITTTRTIEATISQLKGHGIKDAYFDCFFGNKLDCVQKGNKLYDTNYRRSLHLWSNIGSINLYASKPKKGYDIITVPKKMSLGRPREPVIYGAVGSIEKLEKIADDPMVYGAYVRLKEGKGAKGTFKMLWNSVTNTEKLRKITTLAMYSA